MRAFKVGWTPWWVACLSILQALMTHILSQGIRSIVVTCATRAQVAACTKQLRSMGFAPDMSERAAHQARGDVELATSMLFDGACGLVGVQIPLPPYLPQLLQATVCGSFG